jgi:two-component system, cell cycle response regulator DivK
MAKKVLIAEDYDDVRTIMKILIGIRGYEVIEAADGYEAVEKAKEHHPDLILMDLAMPVLDGFIATQAMRKTEEFKKVPIIALTAYDNFYRKAIEAGCNEVVKKPIDVDRLDPLLNQYLH